MTTSKLRIVCISDTHNAAPGEGYTLPKGDILIHAGDLTNQGSSTELRKALAWLRKADYAVKIVIAGNHDLSLDERFPGQNDEEAAELRRLIRSGESNISYLEHESASFNIRGMALKVFGSPYSLASSRSKQWAFQYPPEEATHIWSSIPPNTTILVTHTPPAGHQDASAHWSEGGCSALRRALEQVKPRLHVCGHCHEGRGGQRIYWRNRTGSNGEQIGSERELEVTQWQDPGAGGNKKQSLFDLRDLRSADGGYMPGGVSEQTAVVNASIMAKSHGRGAKAFNKPIVVDMELPAEA